MASDMSVTSVTADAPALPEVNVDEGLSAQQIPDPSGLLPLMTDEPPLGLEAPLASGISLDEIERELLIDEPPSILATDEVPSGLSAPSGLEGLPDLPMPPAPPLADEGPSGLKVFAESVPVKGLPDLPMPLVTDEAPSGLATDELPEVLSAAALAEAAARPVSNKAPSDLAAPSDPEKRQTVLLDGDEASEALKATLEKKPSKTKGSKRKLEDEDGEANESQLPKPKIENDKDLQELVAKRVKTWQEENPDTTPSDLEDAKVRLAFAQIQHQYAMKVFNARSAQIIFEDAQKTLARLVELDQEIKYGKTERKLVSDFRDKILDLQCKYYKTLNATYTSAKEVERQKAVKAREKAEAAAAAAAAKAKAMQEKLEAGETVVAEAGPSGVKKPRKPKVAKANVEKTASAADAAIDKALAKFLEKRIKVFMEANADADEDDIEVEKFRLETKEFPGWYEEVMAKAAAALDL